ncbi:MAG: glycosyltransferase family 4 protein [Candidatus Eremiobacteraeota bacterium]|nr:glycosyltransferase family 4 protein [Candidatus Eremiobacteraeota bacterium]
MRALRLAVDARVVAGDVRGIGRYARAILRRLIERDDVELTLLQFGPFVFRHRGALASALGTSRFTVRSRVAGDADVVWHPANGTFFASKAPNVATIHDAIPFRQPKADPAARAHEQEPILRSARTAARVIADSEFARRDVHDALGIELERIVAIHLGVDSSFSPGPAGALPNGARSGDYVLFVGPIAEPRKNFSVLYEAFTRAWANGASPQLVVVGPAAPAAPNVVHVASVDDDGLRALYRGAIALAIPAYHEGFGLPMLEAMACGTPVLAARASALPEIGGDAALYAGAESAAEWAGLLERIVTDRALRERLSDAGLDRVKAFSWDRCAMQHLDVFRAAANA